MPGKALLRLLVMLFGGFLLLNASTLPERHISFALNPDIYDLSRSEELTIRRSTVKVQLQYHEVDRLSAGQLPDGQLPAAELPRAQAVYLQPSDRFSRGLGSLVTHDKDILLVTHNHWPWLNAGKIPESVQISAGDGRSLITISGAEFFKNILYRDAGVLVLRVPDTQTVEDARYSPLGDSRSVQTGQVVHLTARNPDSPETVDIIAAEVLAVKQVKGIYWLTLRNLNGQSIVVGDSGGGVWHDGQLVGNLWMTVREDSYPWWLFGGRLRRDTNMSHAAGMTSELGATFTLMLTSQTPLKDAGQIPD